MISEHQKLELIQIILTLQDEEVLAKVKAVLKRQTNTSKPPHTNPQITKPRQFGFAQGLISYVAPDFDEPVSGFEDYTPAS